MDSVDIRRVPEGYAVSGIARNLPAAMRAVDAMLAVNDAAFAPGSLDALRIERGANPVNQQTGD